MLSRHHHRQGEGNQLASALPTSGHGSRSDALYSTVLCVESLSLQAKLQSCTAEHLFFQERSTSIYLSKLILQDKIWISNILNASGNVFASVPPWLQTYRVFTPFCKRSLIRRRFFFFSEESCPSYSPLGCYKQVHIKQIL